MPVVDQTTYLEGNDSMFEIDLTPALVLDIEAYRFDMQSGPMQHVRDHTYRQSLSYTKSEDVQKEVSRHSSPMLQQASTEFDDGPSSHDL